MLVISNHLLYVTNIFLRIVNKPNSYSRGRGVSPLLSPLILGILIYCSSFSSFPPHSRRFTGQLSFFQLYSVSPALYSAMFTPKETELKAILSNSPRLRKPSLPTQTHAKPYPETLQALNSTLRALNKPES